MDAGTSDTAQRMNRPTLETLEGRRLLSAAPWVVNGTGRADAIRIAQNGSTVTVTRNGSTTSKSGVASIVVYGGAGDDAILATESVRVPLVLHGDDGDDQLRGGAGDDRLYAGDGDDTLSAGGGDDVLVSIGGASDNDTLTGGAGHDNFWTDYAATDRINDPAGDDVQHEVRSFMSYRIVRGGRATTVPVPLRLAGQRLADPVASGAVTRWKNFSDHLLFPAAGPGEQDIDQNAASDCYFLTGVASVAHVEPDLITGRVADLGDGTYAVAFGPDGKETFVRVDGDLPLNSTGNPYYAGLGREGSVWAAVIEKAWAFYRRREGTYASTEWGRTKEAYQALGLDNVQFQDDVRTFSSAGGLLNAIDSYLRAGNAVAYWTRGDTPTESGLRARHVLMPVRVLRNRAGAATAMVLRDPYKTDGVRAADGANDGYITVAAAQAAAAMRGLTWCRP